MPNACWLTEAYGAMIAGSAGFRLVVERHSGGVQHAVFRRDQFSDTTGLVGSEWADKMLARRSNGDLLCVALASGRTPTALVD